MNPLPRRSDDLPGTHEGYDPEDDYHLPPTKPKAGDEVEHCVVACKCWRTKSEEPGLVKGWCAADHERKERYALPHGGHICLWPDVRAMVTPCA